jgi:hypothetical protein
MQQVVQWPYDHHHRLDTQETAWSPSSPDQVSMVLLQQQIAQLRQDLERESYSSHQVPLSNGLPNTLSTGLQSDVLTSLSQELIQEQLRENKLKQQLLEQQIKQVLVQQTSHHALIEEEQLQTINKYATLPRAIRKDSQRWEPLRMEATRMDLVRRDSNASFGSVGEERYSLPRNKVEDQDHLPFLSLPRKLPSLVLDPKKKMDLLCDICDKKFSSPGHLARHKRTHVDERPFTCPIVDCKSAFKRSDHMRQHYRTHLKRLGHSADDIAVLVSGTYADSNLEANSPQEYTPKMETPPSDEEMRAAMQAAQAVVQQMHDSPSTLSHVALPSLNSPPRMSFGNDALPSFQDLDWNVVETREYHTLPRLTKKPAPGMMFGGPARDDSVSMDLSWEAVEESGPLSMLSSDATLGVNREWYGFE